MVDRINFNPFTGKELTAEQISQLDTNNDGVVSDSELKAQWSWLSSQSVDDESEVNIKTSNSYDVGDTAETEAQLQQYLAVIADEYLESYLTKNSGLTDAERTALQALINSSSNAFLSEYLAQNKTGPWKMQDVIAAYETKLGDEISNNSKALDAIKASIDGYTNNIDTNLENMLSTALTANANKNISNSEWNQIKTKAIQYFMGMMLNGDINTELLSNINPNYAKDSNYKNALAAINKISSATDPVEIQQLMTTAQASIANFLATAGAEKTVGALEDYTQSQMEEAVTASLQSIADKYLEAIVTSDMSDDDKAKIKAILDNCVTKFMSKIAEESSIESYTEVDLTAQFTDFINQQITALTGALIETKSRGSSSNIEASYEELLSVSDAANANGNISTDEKAQIVEAAANLIMNQLLSGMEDIALLNALNSGYKNTSDYNNLLNLMSKIDSAVDADELQQYKDEAQALITKMLDSYTGDQLVAGVNALRPIEISDASKDKIVYNSSISTDYQANVSRSTSRGKQNEDRLEEIQAMAKQDLEAVAESLKAQMRSELGDSYVEADVEKYIQDAMNDTIATFTANVSRRNGHGHYNTSNDEQAFVFLRRSGTKKGRYVYNVQALVNTFIDNFNKTSKEKNASKLDPSLATYDRENVLMESVGNDYYRNKTEKVYGKNNDNNAYAELIEKAKAQLQSVAASLKSSLLAEGVTISMSEIDEIIDECINSTIEDMKEAFQYCQPNGKNTGKAIAGVVGGAAGGIASGVAAGVTSTMITYASTAGVSLGAALTSAGGIATAKTAAGMSFGAVVGSNAGYSIAGPVGWAVGAVVTAYSVLKNFTNLFGATYGKHDSNAGFFFERKSNSHSGNWGYDTQTLVDVFLAKFDAKLEEAKKNKKDNKLEDTSETV